MALSVAGEGASCAIGAVSGQLQQQRSTQLAAVMANDITLYEQEQVLTGASPGVEQTNSEIYKTVVNSSVLSGCLQTVQEWLPEPDRLSKRGSFTAASHCLARGKCEWGQTGP